MNTGKLLPVLIAFAIGWVSPGAASARPPARSAPLEDHFCKRHLKGEVVLITHLFFGLSRANGPDVTDAEFRQFVDTEVTPRFPDGMTLYNGSGQYKDSTGAIVRESSRVLMILHPHTEAGHQAIEAIRSAYKRAFQQKSVLRLDEQSCVSF